MLLPALAILGGFVLLVWSADRFVDGAACGARHLGMPALLVGMVIVGFGTSAPEMVVSAVAALDGSPGLALGNAIGSNIVNIGLVLGFTALLIPLRVHSSIIRREMPLLLAVSLLFGWFVHDLALARWEGSLLLVGFFSVIGWSTVMALRGQHDALALDTAQELETPHLSLGWSVFWIVAGLVLLIASSRALVWGAVNVAQALGVSDLVIGLTIIALGTSLPELAATIAAARKGEHDIALGNIVGSNLFNILAVVGIAGVIAPMPAIDADLLYRDLPVMLVMILALILMAYGWKGRDGQINRIEGGTLLVGFAAYNTWLVLSVINA